MPPPTTAETATETTAARPVVLLFPGQGSQHRAMATGLYGRDPVFTAELDAALELMGPLGRQARNDWLADRPAIEVDDVRRAQPLLFALDYALGRMVESWGVRPAAMLGHSAGEVVAATLSGVFTLAEAAAVVRDRVACAVRIPAGGMLAVAAGAGQLAGYLRDDVVVAAVNARRQTMLAGSTAPLAVVRQQLLDAGHVVVPVPATSPFHSPAMVPAAAAVRRSFAARPRPPDGRAYSGYTARRLDTQDAVSAGFWSRQLTDPVLFGPALERLLADVGDALLLEAGPGQTLTFFARRHPAVRAGRSTVVPLLGGPGGGDREAVLAAAETVYAEGHHRIADAVARMRRDWTEGN
jgi:acyl transferase domain-containing protein